MDLKKYITLGVLSVLAIWAIILNLPQKNSFELDVDEDYFSLSQPETITKIEISLPNRSTVLEKKGSIWLINDNTKAEILYVNRLLDIASKIKLKRNINLSEIDSSQNTFARVSFKNQNNLSKQYFISTAGISKIMDSDRKKCYVAEIPGFSDSFGHFFMANDKTWKTNLLFNSSLRTLNELTIKNATNNSQNIRATYKDGFFLIEGLAQPDTQKVGAYLSQFKEIRYDYDLNDSLKIKARSLLKTMKPSLEITVRDIDSTRNNNLKVFELKENKRFYIGVSENVADTFLINKKTISNLTPMLNQLSKTP